MVTPCLTPETNPARVVDIVRRLESEYGRRELLPNGDPVSTLIETVLSQNTSDANSGRAFRSLRTAFPRWQCVASAEPGQISDAIRAGGLASVKGRRIKEVLLTIERERGTLTLDFLNVMPLERALGWLKALPGVGDKTAACVLLFSLGRPALPVDTHVYRVSRRLGLIDGNISAERAHAILQGLVPEELVHSFHVLMIEHGRKICHARNPACGNCVLAAVCPGFQTVAVLTSEARPA